MKIHSEVQNSAIVQYSSHRRGRKVVLQFIENSVSIRKNGISFQNASQLERYLIARKDVDIWKIEYQRHRNLPQTLYKRENVWGELETYTTRQDLYQEISRDSDGVFEIHDISNNNKNKPQKTFVIDNSGWFSANFVEYDSESKFQAALDSKENHKDLYKRIFWSVMSGLVLFSGSYAGYSFLRSVRDTNDASENENNSYNSFELMNQSQKNNYNHWDWVTSSLLNQNLNLPCLAVLTLGAAGTSVTSSSLPFVLAGMRCLLPHVAADFPAVLELSNLNGTNGFKINGEDPVTFSGYSVSTAGDINGDGIDDIIIGAYPSDPHEKSNAGSSYVIFGHNRTWISPLELSTLDGIKGFKINGEIKGDSSGYSVSTAGDINGDGIDDIIIGAYTSDPHGKASAGSSYVVFGHRGDWNTPLELSTLDGITGFKINGEVAGDWSGVSVSTAGDINGDGVTDLIIGAKGADPHEKSSAGSSYVVFGHRGEWNATFELSTLNGLTGFKINGESGGDLSGVSVSIAGDINGDGVTDLIIGAIGTDRYGKSNAGSSYVIFGHNGAWNAILELSTLDGITGFKINGEIAGDWSGVSVSTAGDVNGDGVDDLIIGAGEANPHGKLEAGSSYVIFGHSGAWITPFELSTLNGINGFKINGESVDDQSGTSVSNAGDINGDGVDDLVIGAYYADPHGKLEAGSSYVIFGHRGEWKMSLELLTLNRVTGLKINGEVGGDRSGYSVSTAGDINGDGVDDLIIGAYFADPHGKLEAGSSYVIFGQLAASSSLSSSPSSSFSYEMILIGGGSGLAALISFIIAYKCYKNKKRFQSTKERLQSTENQQNLPMSDVASAGSLTIFKQHEVGTFVSNSNISLAYSKPAP